MQFIPLNWYLWYYMIVMFYGKCNILFLSVHSVGKEGLERHEARILSCLRYWGTSGNKGVPFISINDTILWFPPYYFSWFASLRNPPLRQNMFPASSLVKKVSTAFALRKDQGVSFFRESLLFIRLWLVAALSFEVWMLEVIFV